MSAQTHMVSWSEISTARQCPKKHEWAYKQRWQPATTAPALSRGILWHELMERHYTLLRDTPGDYAAAMAKFTNEKLRDTGGEFVSDTAALIDWMLAGYLAQWGTDADWKIKAVEHAAEIWLPTDRGGRSRFKLKMKIDLIVSINGKLWLVDHKTCRDLPSDKELELDDQFGLYCWGLRKLGYPVFGCIYNATRTQRNKGPMELDTRFARYMMYRTDAELDTIAVEAYKTLRGIYATPDGAAPRHPDPDLCRWKCPFTEPCLGSRKGQDARAFLISAGFEQNFERH